MNNNTLKIISLNVCHHINEKNMFFEADPGEATKRDAAFKEIWDGEQSLKQKKEQSLVIESEYDKLNLERQQKQSRDELGEYNVAKGIHIAAVINKFEADIVLLQEYESDYCDLKTQLPNYLSTIDMPINYHDFYQDTCVFYKKQLSM
jgi:hypothetical protein